jgi:uncharacterized surface protein with fasciclin (FAS1) repeats
MKYFLIVAGLGVLLAGCNATSGAMSESEPVNPPQLMETRETSTEMAQTQSIVDIAVSNPDFSTLVDAVTEAGLVDTLSGPGPFTVFAPTNAAFEKLPAGTLETVMADKHKLTEILTYHVVSGKVMASDVMSMSSAQTVQGDSVSITTSGDKVMINDAEVIMADIEASNGVIHVIDTVLLP